MKPNKFQIGERVAFRGHANPDGTPGTICVDGPDRFEAIVANKPWGLCYGLRFDDGTPVGVPFHDHQLSRVL